MPKFKPGQSGNPGGRPAIIKSIQELARQHTAESVDALRAALKKPGERVAAAQALLAYGYGRPIQTQNVRMIRSFEDLTDDELTSLTETAQRDEQRTRH